MPGSTCRNLFIFLFVLALAPVFASAQALININTASVEELRDGLTGIGDKKAQDIVDYRTQNGPFQKIEDLGKVGGIPLDGTTFANIKDFITVGVVSGTESEGEEEDDSQDSPANTTSNTSNTNSNSAHYSSTPLSDSKSAKGISIGIGRDRLGSVDSPLEFKVESDGGRDSDFEWNFGDGFTGNGKAVTHTYEYPGEYVIVLNADLPDGKAVARIDVKIVESEVAVTLATAERVEIKNNSMYEISLYGRALVSGEKIFTFPQDTIIKAGQSISFGSRVTGISADGLHDANLMVVGESRNQFDIVAKIEEEKAERIVYLQDQIAVLQQQMASISVPNLAVQPPSEEAVTAVEKDIVEAEEGPIESEEIEEIEPQTATAREGWLGTIKRFFLRTK